MRPYVRVSGLLFGLVAVVHLIRAIRRWPLLIGGIHSRGGSLIVFVLAGGVALWHGGCCRGLTPLGNRTRTGEGAFGLFFLGAFSFVPTLLAWLAGGVHMFMASWNRDVRLGVALTTAHVVQ